MEESLTSQCNQKEERKKKEEGLESHTFILFVLALELPYFTKSFPGCVKEIMNIFYYSKNMKKELILRSHLCMFKGVDLYEKMIFVKV